VKRESKSNSDGNQSMTKYIGMDLHKNFLQIAVMDSYGTVLENTRIENDMEKIDGFFQNTDRDNTKIVMEWYSVWYNIYCRLKDDKKMDVILSNPIKTKAIASAKIKTDKIDARVLADLLRGGYIAQCYVPDKEVINLRDLVRHRDFLVRTRTKIKNKIHGVLLMNGIKLDARKPFSKRYIWELKEMNNYRIDSYLAVLESLDIQIKRVSEKIADAAKKDSMAKLLVTIPGIGYYSALLISSEIGNIERFSDSHRLCAYAGLVPSTHSSGGTTYNSIITKTGSGHLRWVLTECVHTHIRYEKDSNITRFYNKLAKKKGTAKATVAAASKLLRVIYCMLKEAGNTSITVRK